MSQAKVDRYKEEKANRKKILAKEKRKRIAGTICGWLIALLIVGWAGYSGYNAYEKSKPIKTPCRSKVLPKQKEQCPARRADQHQCGQEGRSGFIKYQQADRQVHGFAAHGC